MKKFIYIRVDKKKEREKGRENLQVKKEVTTKISPCPSISLTYYLPSLTLPSFPPSKKGAKPHKSIKYEGKRSHFSPLPYPSSPFLPFLPSLPSLSFLPSLPFPPFPSPFLSFLHGHKTFTKRVQQPKPLVTRNCNSVLRVTQPLEREREREREGGRDYILAINLYI